MATLKDDDSEEVDKEELIDGLDVVAAHTIDVSLSQDQPDNENIFSRMASIDDDDEHSSYVSGLNYVIAFNALKRDVLQCNISDFNGIMIKTGAARGSSGGKKKFFAYCKAMGQKPVLDDTRAARFYFGIGTTISSGVGILFFR